MNILLVTIGSAGDVFPFIGIGRALRQRGHSITLVANGPFATHIQNAGLDFIELGDAHRFESILDNPDLWHPRKGFRAVFELGILPLVEPTYRIVADAWQTSRPLVVAHAIALGARIAQEKFGIPMATVHLSPATIFSAASPPRFPGLAMPSWMPTGMKRTLFDLADALVLAPVVSAPINRIREKLDLRPVRRILYSWWNSPQRVIGLFPDWFSPPQVDWPPQTRLTGFPLFDGRAAEPLGAELAAFLSAGEAPIVASFGSANKHANQHFDAVVRACTALGRRGVLLTRYAQQLPGNLPANVRHFAYAPFGEILPRAAAFIHHGGIGTTAQALAAGVPQGVAALSHDQYDNAERVERLGAGRWIKRIDADTLTSSLANLLRPEMRDRCRQVATLFQTPSAIERACQLIEELK